MRRGRDGARSQRRLEQPAIEHAAGDKYLDRIADKAKALRVDVLCMQEVQARSLRAEGYDQTAHIAKQMGFKYWKWAEATSDGAVLNRQGNAIISRFPILESRRIVLNKARGEVEQRVALLARIAWPPAGKQGVWAVSTHLYQKGDDSIRQAQLAVLAGAVKKLQGPLVVTGDFNARPTAQSIQELLGGSLGRPMFDSLAEAGKGDLFTSPSAKPSARIDYTFHDAGLQLVQAAVPAKSPTDSDHLPMLAEFRLPAAPAPSRRNDTPSFDDLMR
jgi:endonuclease/exonuclease/phosphatase family metal-dependent hydrolase